jgi:hypothetical protein
MGSRPSSISAVKCSKSAIRSTISVELFSNASPRARCKPPRRCARARLCRGCRKSGWLKSPSHGEAPRRGLDAVPRGRTRRASTALRRDPERKKIDPRSGPFFLPFWVEARSREDARITLDSRAESPPGAEARADEGGGHHPGALLRIILVRAGQVSFRSTWSLPRAD